MITELNEERASGRKCLLLFSGGFDSTFVALLLRRAKVPTVSLSFNYPGRPNSEKLAAARLADKLLFKESIEFMLPIYDDRTRKEKWISTRHEGWIAHRNIIFFALAAHYAFLHGCDVIAAGVRVWDTTAYDDATSDFLETLEILLQNSGSRRPSAARLELFLPILHSHEPIKKFIGANTDSISELVQTWSCWRDGSAPCGDCAPCRSRVDFFATLGVQV